MTIMGWAAVVGISAVVVAVGGCVLWAVEGTWEKILSAVVTAIVVAGVYLCGRWYFTNTASGQRALVDQKANVNGGLERTITVYTADGKQLAQYTGKIDIEGNDGGYVLFDYEGKRYTYYNCFVESIAKIG